MTQATYEPGYGAGAEPAGTSVLAILSLVCGVLGILLACLIIGGAVFGPLAILLGIIALLTKGAKGGGGLAIGGIITGLISIVIAASIAFGFGAAFNQFAKFGDIAAEAQRGDVDAVRARLSTTASNELTDQQITDWGQGLTSEWGQSQGAPGGIFEIFGGYTAFADYPNFAQWLQNQGQQNDVIPVPVGFDQGRSLIFIRLDTASASGSPGLADVAYIYRDDSGLVWLRAGEQLFLPAPAPTPPATPAPDATDPADPDDGGN